MSKEYKARNESIKIRDSERQNIEKVVLECCVYVGIIKEENVPQGMFMGVITSFIIDSLGGYTSDEFILAFKYVASGKISIPKEKDHFQVFSPKYLGFVMGSYSEYLSRNNLSVYKIIDEQTKTNEQINEADNKAKFTIGGFVLNHIIDQKFSEITPYKSCYNLVKDCGYMEDQTKEDKKEMFNSFKSEYIKDLKKLCVKEKESLKEFMSKGVKNDHFDNIIQLIKIHRYKSWIKQNKSIDLEEFKKDFKSKINDIIKQNS